MTAGRLHRSKGSSLYRIRMPSLLTPLSVTQNTYSLILSHVHAHTHAHLEKNFMRYLPLCVMILCILYYFISFHPKQLKRKFDGDPLCQLHYYPLVSHKCSFENGALMCCHVRNECLLKEYLAHVYA